MRICCHRRSLGLSIASSIACRSMRCLTMRQVALCLRHVMVLWQQKDVHFMNPVWLPQE